jgi:hypothetical protein
VTVLELVDQRRVRGGAVVVHDRAIDRLQHVAPTVGSLEHRQVALVGATGHAADDPQVAGIRDVDDSEAPVVADIREIAEERDVGVRRGLVRRPGGVVVLDVEQLHAFAAGRGHGQCGQRRWDLVGVTVLARIGGRACGEGQNAGRADG